VPAALLGAAVLGLHPTMVTAVPVIARRYDALSAALLFGALVLLLRRQTGWSLVLFGAALLAKESAFAAIPLLPLILFAAWSAPEVPSRASASCAPAVATRLDLRSYARALLPFIALGVVLFALRYAVLGTLGGHASVDIFTTNFEQYRVMLDRYILFLFWPFHAWYPERTLGWFALVTIVVALLGLALRYAEVRTRVLVGVGLLWILGFGAFFILLRHIAGPWYMYYPLLGMALAVGAAADGLWLTLRRSASAPVSLTLGGGASARVLATSALAGLAAIYAVGSFATSPLVQPWAEWHQAGQVMREYLAGIRDCTEGIPDGVAVTLWNSPALFDDGSDQSALLAATMIEGFTYDAYMHLIRPDQHFNLFIGQPLTYHSVPEDLQLSCDWAGPDRRRVIATSAELPAPKFPTD
jgi:hypothetical protein